jgi:tetratricopeptide (TPR) repeat protein
MAEIPDDEDIASGETLPSGESHGGAIPLANKATVDETLPGVAPRDDTLAAGTEVGRYVIEHRLGAGAMGVVYAARDPELDRGVAIKLLRPGYNADQRERLVREAQALARVAHPNVVGVHDVGTRGDRVFVAMELVRGQTLRGWLAGDRDQRAILDMIIAAGRGLAAAHAADLVHRDFKPDNVLIGEDGRARVTDFGLARVHDDEDDGVPAGPGTPPAPSDGTPLAETLTRTGTLLGTPIYAAPEQLAGQRVTQAADQFSFCVTAYEALCGTRPFIAYSIPELIAVIARNMPALPRDGRSPPPRIMAALLRGLSPDPDARFPSMDALLAELTPVEPERRRGAMIAAIAGGGALVVGGAVIAYVVATRGSSSCDGVDAPIRAVWNADARSRVANPAIVASLDRYAETWIFSRRQLCTEHGVRPGGAAAMEWSCLDNKVDELRGLLAVLSASDAATQHAIVKRMALPHSCRGFSIPLDATLTDEANAVMRADIEIRRQFTFDDRAAARARLPAMVARADATGYAPLQAMAHGTAGYIAVESGDLKRGADELRAAIRYAEAGQDDHGKAWHAVSLAAVLVDQGALDEAEHISGLADAALVRIGGDPGLSAFHLPSRAKILSARGNHAEAIALLERAAATRFAVLDGTSLETANLLASLSAAYAKAGRTADAQRANALLSPVIAMYYGSAGADVVAEMIAEQTDALFAGDARRAAELGAQIVSLVEAKRGPDDLDVGRQRFVLASTYEMMDNWRAARDEYERASKTYERLGRAADRAAALEGAARAAYELGDLAAAVALLRTCVAVSEKLDASGDEQRTWARYALGRALGASGSIDEAMTELDWALPRIEAFDPPQRNGLGGVRFALAQTLWQRGKPGDRERARALVEQARLDFLAHRDKFPADATNIEALYRRRMDQQVAKVDAWMKNK